MCNITHMIKACNVRNNRMNMRKKIISGMSLPLKNSEINVPVKRYSSECSKTSSFGVSTRNELLTENNFHQEGNNYFFEKYELLEKIGQGANSTIYKCKSKRSNQFYAVKVMRLRDEELIENFTSQFEKHKELSHDSIIQHYEFILDNAKMTSYSIIEYCDFKNLKEELYSRPEKKFSEKEAAKVLHSILDALSYLHQKGVAHRDLKPQNILYNADNGQIKLIDFECSKYKKETQNSFQMWTKTGTLNYEAPEIFLNAIYSEKVDNWAVGIIAYELLTGKLPFYSSYSNKTVKMIISNEIDFQSINISAVMKLLLKGLLQKVDTQRIEVSQALELCSSLIN